MAESTSAIKHMETTKEVAVLRKKFYAESNEAAMEGKPVGWCCVAIPKEILYAMDINAVYPENFATVCASKKLSSSFCQVGERHGVPRDVCGYARIVMGYMFGGKDAPEAPYGGLPDPQFLAVRSSACDSRLGWFMMMARRHNLPLYVMDAPYQPDAGCADIHDMGYTRAQLEEFVAFLEKHTGRKLDRDRLRENMILSRRARQAQFDIDQLRKAVPCPMGSADAYTAVWPGMYLAGTKECDDFYARLKGEVRDRIDKKMGIVEEEKFRIMWSGIPFWYNMRLVNYFEQFGGVVVIETTYTRDEPEPFPETGDPIEAMASQTTVFRRAGAGIEAQVESTLQMAREYQVDGVVLSFNPSCRINYIPQLELKNALEAAGVPTLSLECDMADERTYSEGQVLTRINAFIERLLSGSRV